MSTSQEVRDPAHEWLGCEAMLSVPPFGLKPPDDDTLHGPACGTMRRDPGTDDSKPSRPR